MAANLHPSHGDPDERLLNPYVHQQDRQRSSPQNTNCIGGCNVNVGSCRRNRTPSSGTGARPCISPHNGDIASSLLLKRASIVSGEHGSGIVNVPQHGCY